MPEHEAAPRSPLARRLSRRSLIASTGWCTAGLAAVALVGCESRSAVAPARERKTVEPSPTPSPTATPSIRRGGTWRIALSADPASLDPYAAPGANARIAAAPVYSRLLAYESGPGKARVSFATVPDAAEFTQAPDARTFIARLNPRARFSAPVARAMTSADVKHSVERALASLPDDAPPGLALIESVETPDERTVTFRLKEPFGAFAPVLADARGVMLMPAGAAKAFDPAKQAAGSGPFLLRSYDPGVALTYARNPEWHLGAERPFVDGIQMHILRDAPAALAQFVAGGLDALPVAAADLKKARDGVKGVIVDVAPPLQVQNITFSGLDVDAPWRDVRVRRAVSMALNRDAMLDDAFGLKEMRAAGVDVPYTWDGFLPWGITGYSLDPKQMKPERLPSFRFSLTEAGRLLDAAGWRDGFGVEWHYTGAYRGGYPLNARLVAQQLRDVKINLRTTVEEHSAVFTGSTVPGNFRGLASIAWSLGEPGNYLTAMYLPTSPRNSGRIRDAHLAEMIAAITANANREERRQQILDVQDYLADRMYNVPLPNGPALTAYQPQARNVAEYAAHGVAAAVDQLPSYWKA